MPEPTAARDAALQRPRSSISVIVPTWNEAKYLPSLLAALNRQTIPPLEILVADSGSTDGTQEVGRAAGAIVSEGERRGPGEGRNRGARASRGDILLFADADCVVPPILVETVAVTSQDPEIVGGATGFAPADGGGFGRGLFYLANGYQRAMTIWGFPHNAGYCFFFRRKAFEELGGIREDLPLNETHDLAMRSRALGRFVILPITVQTSMRRFRAHGYARTILREYVASTILFYATGRTRKDLFRPEPAR
jgi:glycosyltransferase involved in cell wall biosynthesis